MAYTATYNTTDLLNISIDIVGKFMAALGENAASIALLIIVTIIVALVVDLLTGVFGIVSFIRRQGR